MIPSLLQCTLPAAPCCALLSLHPASAVAAGLVHAVQPSLIHSPTSPTNEPWLGTFGLEPWTNTTTRPTRAPTTAEALAPYIAMNAAVADAILLGRSHEAIVMLETVVTLDHVLGMKKATQPRQV